MCSTNLLDTHTRDVQRVEKKKKKKKRAANLELMH